MNICPPNIRHANGTRRYRPTSQADFGSLLFDYVQGVLLHRSDIIDEVTIPGTQVQRRALDAHVILEETANGPPELTLLLQFFVAESNPVDFIFNDRVMPRHVPHHLTLGNN